MRRLGVVLAVGGLLLFANINKNAGDSEEAFRASVFPDALSAQDLSDVVQAHTRDTAVQALIEYVSLLVAGTGLVMAVLGPRLPFRSRPASGTGVPRLPPGRVPSATLGDTSAGHAGASHDAATALAP